jgi:uncharacterized protein (DUF305 family)
MNTYTAWGIAGVAVLGAVLLFAYSDMSPSVTSEADRKFIEEMIPHHEGAIAMAEVALQRSTNPDVLTLSRGIIEAQTKENNDMSAWYLAWFGVAVPEGGGTMHGMHGAIEMRGMEGDLDALVGAENFDREYLSQMIVHHEMAVMMSRMLAVSTERSEMRALADTIVASQIKEIEMMQSWLSVLE